MIVLSERLTGQLTDPADYQASYGFRAVRWSREIVPILREIGAQQLIRETGFSAGSIYALFRNPPSTPHRRRRAVFEEIAIRHARRRLIEWGERPSRTKRSIMAQYLSELRDRLEHVRRCGHCGRPLDDYARSDARYCSSRCRQAVRRARAAGVPQIQRPA